MKAVFVNPFFCGRVYAPSLGLLFIATYVRDNSDHDVAVIEPYLEGLSVEETLAQCDGADLVGLVSYTESRFVTMEFAQRVKERNPSCLVILGGPHAAALDRLIIEREASIDAVVRGDGEIPVLDILEGRPLEEIPGVTCRTERGAVSNPPGAFGRNIDRFRIDYSLASGYLESWRDLEVPKRWREKPHMPAMASRGCPYNCAFCAAPAHWERSWRGLSAEVLAERIESWRKNHGAGYIRFYDALFIGSNKKIAEFCDIIEERGIDIPFRIDIRVGTPPELLERLYRAGCRVVGFGVESGSDRVLERLRKGIKRSEIEKTFKDCRRIGLWIIGFFMISMPGEEAEDLDKTLELLRYCDEYNFQLFKIYPNTHIYEELKASGEISDEDWFSDRFGEEVFHTRENFPSARLTWDEMVWIYGNEHYSRNFRRPGPMFERNGLLKGTMVYLGSLGLVGARRILGRKNYTLLRDRTPLGALRGPFRSFQKKAGIEL